MLRAAGQVYHGVVERSLRTGADSRRKGEPLMSTRFDSATPGPWVYDPGVGLILQANGVSMVADPALLNQDNNGQLLAAAPDLLRAGLDLEDALRNAESDLRAHYHQGCADSCLAALAAWRKLVEAK